MAITSKFVFNPFTGNFDSTIDANLSYAQVKYVDRNNPFNYTPDGSIDKPYKTIEAMYDAITDASASKRYAIVIAPGTYLEAATIAMKGWIDLTSFATDTVVISIAGGATFKWSNNNPGRVFIKDIGFSSGLEVLNDNPTGTSGMVFDLDNVDAPSLIFNGRGGGVDYIQLRNDTRIGGSCTIKSAATTIFDSTNIATLIMNDVGCVNPDTYGSAITASLRSNYIGAVQITATSYDIFTDAWGTVIAGGLTIASSSPSYPCYFNYDATSYPQGSITLTGANPAQLVATSKAEAIRYNPSTPASWPVVPDDVKEGLDYLRDSITGNQLLTKEPTGFPNRTDSVMTFNDGSRVFQIAPTGASFDVYIKGNKYTKTTESITLSNDPGNHYIYYTEAGVLSETTAFSPSLFENNALVSIIYWNTNESEHSYFAEERHGLVMDGATHGYLHTVFGARYLTGLALQSFVVDGDGTLDTQSQFQADSGTIRDEDLVITFSPTSNIPVLFREGTEWRKKAADAYPVIYNGTVGYTGTNIAYNELVGASWQLSEVINNNFVLMHVFATNDIETPFVAILGINSYANIPEARAGADSEISSLSGLPFAEFVAIGTVIFQTNSAYTNATKSLVRSASAGENYVDFRGEQLYTPSGVATSHSLLSNLSSDDHPQYVKKAGDTMSGNLNVSVPVVGTTSLGGQGITSQSTDTNYNSFYTLDGSGVQVLDPGVSNLETTIYPDYVTLANNDLVAGTATSIVMQSGQISLQVNNGVATVPTAPTLPEHVTTKKYVDDEIAAIPASSGQANTASNVGSGTGLFKQKVGVDLEFKSLVAGDGLSITSGTNEVTISSTAGDVVGDSKLSYVNPGVKWTSANGATIYKDDFGTDFSELYPVLPSELFTSVQTLASPNSIADGKFGFTIKSMSEQYAVASQASASGSIVITPRIYKIFYNKSLRTLTATQITIGTLASSTASHFIVGNTIYPYFCIAPWASTSGTNKAFYICKWDDVANTASVVFTKTLAATDAIPGSTIEMSRNLDGSFSVYFKLNNTVDTLVKKSTSSESWSEVAFPAFPSTDPSDSSYALLSTGKFLTIDGEYAAIMYRNATLSLYKMLIFKRDSGETFNYVQELPGYNNGNYPYLMHRSNKTLIFYFSTTSEFRTYTLNENTFLFEQKSAGFFPATNIGLQSELDKDTSYRSLSDNSDTIILSAYLSVTPFTKYIYSMDKTNGSLTLINSTAGTASSDSTTFAGDSDSIYLHIPATSNVGNIRLHPLRKTLANLAAPSTGLNYYIKKKS